MRKCSQRKSKRDVPFRSDIMISSLDLTWWVSKMEPWRASSNCRKEDPGALVKCTWWSRGNTISWISRFLLQIRTVVYQIENCRRRSALHEGAGTWISRVLLHVVQTSIDMWTVDAKEYSILQSVILQDVSEELSARKSSIRATNLCCTSHRAELCVPIEYKHSILEAPVRTRWKASRRYTWKADLSNPT